MAELFTIENLLSLLMLTLLQAVLGFDNLLYISIESKRVAEEERQKVRRLGIGLAIGLRIVLLFVVVKLIGLLQDVFLTLDNKAIAAEINGHSLIVLAGGAFILYTAVKEIFHMLAVDDLSEGDNQESASVAKTVTMIVIMNLVFSFDSILGAMALTDVTAVMAVAIIISGLLMIWLADHVSEFLRKNRMYEVLGLFVLFIVGIMLVSEGGHLAHIKLFGHEVHAMSKSTFYFVLAILVVVDIVQGRYQKKILAERERALAAAEKSAKALAADSSA